MPEGWAWARISQFAQAKGGKRVPKGMNLQAIKTLYPYLRVTDMKEETILLDKLLYASESIWEKIKGYTINNEDIYLTIAGTIGRAGSVPLELNNSLLTENALKIINYSPMNKSYLIKALNSNVAQNQFNNLFKQVAQPKLSIKSTLSTLIPIPPLAEQIRIVDRLSEGMELVKLIELEQHDLQELSSRLKKLVLDGAMQGTLLPQNSDDEPASILLDKIRAEKQKLFKEGKIKKKDLEDIQPTLDEDNAYYQNQPIGWTQTQLKTVIVLTSGRDLPSDKYYDDCKTGVPYITGANNFSKDTINTNRYTCEPETLAYKGNILLSVKGTIGKIAQSPYEKAHIARQIMAIDSLLMSSSFVKYFLEWKVPYLQFLARSMIPGISRTDILNLTILCPPLNEQYRIVGLLTLIYQYIESIELSV